MWTVAGGIQDDSVFYCCECSAGWSLIVSGLNRLFVQGGYCVCNIRGGF